MSKNIDINNLGTFASIAAVWAAYPEGGQEGDYLYIGSVKYRWNKYNLLWENAATYTESDARKLTELYADVTVNNDLHVGGTLYYHRMKGYDLGLFSTIASLQAAYPSPEVGMWAFVVHPSISGKYQLYSCATAGTWTLSVSETTLDVLDFERYEEALALMQQLANGAQLSGYRAAEAVSDLPVTDVDPTLGWIVGNHLYVWVGEGGDVLDGKYKDCGYLRGAKGDKGDKGDNGVVLDGVTVFSSSESLDGKTVAEKEEMVPDGNMVEEINEDLHDAIWEVSENTEESDMTSLFSFTDGQGVLQSGPKSDSNSSFAYSNIVALPKHTKSIKIRLPYRPTSGSNIGMAFYSSNEGYISGNCVGGKITTSYSSATNLNTTRYLLDVPEGATHLATSWFSTSAISSGTGTLTPFSCVAVVFVEQEKYAKRFIADKESIDGVDLVISDEDDNDIAVFYDGHFRTKYFNSKELLSARYVGKRLCILGDSISTFGVPDQNNATGTWTYAGNRCRYPQGSLFTNVTLCYWYKLLQATGMVLGINESWAGSRVSWDGSTESTDIGANKHIASLTRIGHLGENGIPDVILVYAGTNDAGHSVTVGTFDTTDPSSYTEEQIAALPVNTFANAYRTMLIRLQYYYPTSEIICCFPNYTTSYYNVSKLDNYNEVVRTACDYFGVKYIDLRTAGITMFNRDSYLPDGIHPNANGMRLIYEKIYNNIIFG